MRGPTDRQRLERFMSSFGAAASDEARAYLTGGATAVLFGWRESTIDIDLVLAPESESLLKAIPALKEELEINVELASPLDFIPVPEGWEERSTYIEQHGSVAYYHFDLYAQALSKVERGHAQDLKDIRAMQQQGLIEPRRAREYFDRIEPELYRFPAIDPPGFRRAVEQLFAA